VSVNTPPFTVDFALLATPPEGPQTDPARSGIDEVPGQNTSPTEAQQHIARLLADVVNHLISAGFELASVRARMPDSAEQSVLELATKHLDTALIDIRHLAVRNAISVHPAEEESQS
jgi:hypothetical protein